MRYRAFGPKARSISAVTLSLGPTLPPDHAAALVRTGLSVGINGFQLVDPAPDLSAALGEALRGEDRAQLVVLLRVGALDPRAGARPARDLSGQGIASAVETTLAESGFARLDGVLIDSPSSEALAPDTLPALEALRAAGRASLVGVGGEAEAADEALGQARLDLLGAAYNIRSGWPQRNRLKAAGERGLSLIGERFLPSRVPREAASAASEGGLIGRFFRRRADPAESDAYAFLRRTPGWTEDEICLAYALTEPALSTVLIDPVTPEDVVRLAESITRDLPSALPAQIEMARFSVGD